MAKQNDKDEKLEEVLKKLNKTYGAESVTVLGDMDDVVIDWISTGSIGLDYVMGGGFPRGRIIEISGAQSSGKSVLSLHFIARAQRAGLKCAFIDAEHAFSDEFSRKIGVNTDALIFNAPQTGEEGLTVVEELVKSGVVDVIVVDSVASLTPEKEFEGELVKQDMALQAKMLAKFLRRVTAEVAKNKVVLIMLNQLRDNFKAFGYGPTTQTPGGHSLRFYASIRLQVAKGNKIKKGDEVIGNDIKIKAEKNKVSNPFRECELEIIYSKGIDLEAELIEKGLQWKVLKKSGNTISHDTTILGSTKDKAKQYLTDNHELAEEIRNEILKYTKIVSDVEEAE